MEIGDKVTVIERTHSDGNYEWGGEITKITDAYVETKHRRDFVSHPQFRKYNRAYESTWVKHYYHPDGKLNNIKF